jgi:hypothetical protein
MDTADVLLDKKACRPRYRHYRSGRDPPAPEDNRVRSAAVDAFGHPVVSALDPGCASPDPQAAASLVMATFDGLIIQWLLTPEQIPSGRVTADTLKRAAELCTVSAESIDAV